MGFYQAPMGVELRPVGFGERIATLCASIGDVPKLRVTGVTSLATTLTARHRRILSSLSHDDLLWEVPGQPYFTQFNERTGKQIRIRLEVLEQMEQLGLIRRQRQTQSAHKLDFWEITAQGREALREMAADRKAASSDHPNTALRHNRKSA